MSTNTVYSVTFTLDFDLLFKIINYAYNFGKVSSAKALIVYMNTPCDNSFLLKMHIFCPLHLSKKLTLVII